MLEPLFDPLRTLSLVASDTLYEQSSLTIHSSKRRENSAPVHEVSAYQEHNRFGGTVGDKPNNSHAAELNGPGLHVPAELDSAARHRQYN